MTPQKPLKTRATRAMLKTSWVALIVISGCATSSVAPPKAYIIRSGSLERKQSQEIRSPNDSNGYYCFEPKDFGRWLAGILNATKKASAGSVEPLSPPAPSELHKPLPQPSSNAEESLPAPATIAIPPSLQTKSPGP